MKKLLATLIVAVMLISCVSVVSFAAGSTITTIAAYPYAALGTVVDEELTDDIGLYYYENFRGITGLSSKNAKATEIYGLLATGIADDESATIPASVGDYVFFPLTVSEVGSFSVNVTWDATYLTYVGCTDDYNGQVKDVTTNSLNFNGFNSAGENVNGILGALLFSVNTTAEGDEKGEASTAISFTIDEVKGMGNVDASIVTGTMTAKIKGLVPGSTTPTKPEKVTGDDDTTAGAVTIGDAVTMADVSGFTAAAGDDATLLAGKANVINNDGDPALYDGTYQIFFGKNDFSGVSTAPAKVGLALYEDGNFKGLYEAQSIISDKWGILFYGLNSSKTYSVKQYIQYDGEAAIIAE